MDNNCVTCGAYCSDTKCECTHLCLGAADTRQSAELVRLRAEYDLMKRDCDEAVGHLRDVLAARGHKEAWAFLTRKNGGA